MTDVELADLRARVKARVYTLHGPDCVCEKCFAKAEQLLQGVPMPASQRDEKKRRRRR